MAVEIFPTGVDSSAALMYGLPHQGTVDYLYKQVSELSSAASGMVSEWGNRFIEKSRELVERFNSNGALDAARLAITKAGNLFRVDEIRPLKSLSELQACQPVMQRYIMACPEVRTLYHQQRCDGYSDTYIDAEPGKIGRDHTDYCSVIDGVVFHTEDGDTYSHFIDFEPALENDPVLLPTQKIDILSAWDVARTAMAKGDDPTDVYGGKL